MIVLAKHILDDYIKKNVQAKKPVENWLTIVRNSRFKSSTNIKIIFASASFRPQNQVIFNIGGNKYRLFVKVEYKDEIMRIEWIGIHAEYSKMKF